MPNTLGIAKKGILEKTGMPIELGISSGTIRVIVKKKPYSISKAWGDVVEFMVGGIEFI